VGGGIKDPNTAKKIVSAGADAIVIGTLLEKNGSLKNLTAIAKAVRSVKK
jgi:phosphoglycerol geranylgeranyltransferase